jgi:acyl-CoA synthetase (NDP forming)
MPSGHELDSMFYPGSVAIVGASANPTGWGGTSYLRRLRELGFTGDIYPVNPKATEVQGFKAYPTVSSIPAPVDLVIIAIPAAGVPAVLEDCAAAGARNIHIFTSGFSETGEAEGIELDKKIAEIIKRGNLRVVGPNCMGIYVPASKLTPWGARPVAPGPVAFVSQSGGHGEYLTDYAQKLGVYFSKVISFGNARGLQAMDFIEYLADDPETSIITMYLEGIKDGNRFTRLVRDINRTKPVVIWKGGLTSSGSRAAASHTGSLAGEGRVWDAFFAQTGAIRVNSLEEIVDIAMALLHLKVPRGRRILLLGGGGGNSVAQADIWSRQGLDVPPLSEKTRRELNTFIRIAGNSTRNPLDVWQVQEDVDQFRRTVELAVADPVIDLVVVDRHVGYDDDDMPDIKERYQRYHRVNRFIIDFARQNQHNKPLVVGLNSRGNDTRVAAAAAKLWTQFALAGIPTYASQEGAARAVSRFIKYHEFLCVR